MARVRMDARTFRYYLWAWPTVFASSTFYTAIVVTGLKQIFGIDDAYLKSVELATYVIFCLLGLCYFAPKLKSIEFGGTLDGRYTSIRAPRVAIFVGASIGTVLSVPVIDKVGFFE